MSLKSLLDNWFPLWFYLAINLLKRAGGLSCRLSQFSILLIISLVWGWKSDYKSVLYWCHHEYVETRREIPVKSKSCSFKKYFVFIFVIIKWSNTEKVLLPFLLLMPPCQSVIMSNAWKKTLVEVSFSFLCTTL